MTGEIIVPLGSLEAPPLSAKKVIGRRAAMELTENTVVNLGIGIPEYISAVANYLKDDVEIVALSDKYIEKAKEVGSKICFLAFAEAIVAS